ncbi:hypothetical protein N7488_000798 [Penicillium malachiteum]|nr:hypothetical protein N7488_000798 [Penicillium malachiteum]
MGSPSPSEPRVSLPTDPEHVTIIAECLSAHLATQEVEPESQRQPNIHLVETGSSANDSPVTEKTVKLGKAFILYVSPSDLDENGRGTFAALSGATDNGAVVVYSGKPGDAADIGGVIALEFLAIGEGETDIYAYAAHRSILTPGVARCRVNVVRN